MFDTIKEEIQVVFERDPAARSTLETIFTCPGFQAILFHRFNHWLWQKKLFLLARMTAHIARFLTGIEIHPAAKIGRRFFIDHGMGVVIGETSEIGDDVFMYQGVTLGGLSSKAGKRHPTVGNFVVIGAGANLLGPIHIGDYTKIGSGSVVLQSVPEYSVVVGVPGRVVYSGASKLADSGEDSYPDPVAQAIECVLEKLPQMEKEIRSLKDKLDSMGIAKDS